MLVTVCIGVCCPRWRMRGMQTYNPEHIMLSAVARRTSRDVNIMKEKLIISGAALTTFTSGNGCLGLKLDV